MLLYLATSWPRQLNGGRLREKMEKILFAIVFSSAFSTVFAQKNLLTNGNFETETVAGSKLQYQLSVASLQMAGDSLPHY